MNIRQRLLKVFYPLVMLFSKRKEILMQSEHAPPHEPFHNLHATLNSGKPFSFDQLKGKYVLLVNTASECGYTAQYKQLQELHEQFGNRVQVLGFPSNDFGGQEPAEDKDIAGFCQVNFGVRFPLMQKSAVKGRHQNKVFQWLTHQHKNGWNNEPPSWNFCKYLVSKEGSLLGVYPSAISPLDEEILQHFS